MPIYKTEGIILKRNNLQEADRLVTILTRHHGKIKVIAKGSRKITSRKGSSVELFNHVQLSLSSGKNFDILTEILVLNNFQSWRLDLKKIGVAYYFTEVIDKLIPEKQENKTVFEILNNGLRDINHNSLYATVRNFEENLLDELGYGIPLKIKEKKGSLKDYIEEIIERKIFTPKIVHDLFK